jgi:hypothetical protein
MPGHQNGSQERISAAGGGDIEAKLGQEPLSADCVRQPGSARRV